MADDTIEAFVARKLAGDEEARFEREMNISRLERLHESRGLASDEASELEVLKAWRRRDDEDLATQLQMRRELGYGGPVVSAPGPPVAPAAPLKMVPRRDEQAQQLADRAKQVQQAIDGGMPLKAFNVDGKTIHRILDKESSVTASTWRKVQRAMSKCSKQTT